MTDATVNATTDNTPPPVAQTEETSPYKIYAGNLPLDITEEELKTFFGDQIHSVEIIAGNNAKVAFGYAYFSDDAAVKAALELDGNELNGKKVKVQLPKSSEQKVMEKNERRARRRGSGRRGNRIVSGQNLEAEADVDGTGATPATDVTPKPKRKKRNYRNRPRTRRDSSTPAEGTPAAEVDPVSAEDTPKSSQRRAKKGKRGFPNSYAGAPDGDLTKSMVFVANIPFKYNDRQLRERFQEGGFKVRYAKICRKYNDSQGRWVSNGFGFVDLVEEDVVEDGKEKQETIQETAIRIMSGKDFDSREITVAKYSPNARRAKATDSSRSAEVTVAYDEAPENEPLGSADNGVAAPASAT